MARILRNPKGHNRVHYGPPTVHILSQINPVHNLPIHFLQTVPITIPHQAPYGPQVPVVPPHPTSLTSPCTILQSPVSASSLPLRSRAFCIYGFTFLFPLTEIKPKQEIWTLHTACHTEYTIRRVPYSIPEKTEPVKWANSAPATFWKHTHTKKASLSLKIPIIHPCYDFW